MSWLPVDLTPFLHGDRTDPPPSVLRRSDGFGLLYAGRVNSVFSETEGCKSWLALIACAEQIVARHHVAYFDFEDEADVTVGRLLALGVPAANIQEFFHYVHPATKWDANARELLTELMQIHQPTVAVVDGVTDAMAMFGLVYSRNEDVAAWTAMFLRPMARSGACVLTLDHVPKDPDAHGRYSIGGVHKINGLDGAAYKLTLSEPFGRGMTGIVRLDVMKDRPGFVRTRAMNAKHAGMLTLASDPTTNAVTYVLTPVTDEFRVSYRPTRIMEAASKVLEAHPGGLSQRDVESRVPARATTIRKALAMLSDDGYADHVEGPRRAILWHSVKPYREDM